MLTRVTDPESERKHVVIIGGGFAGLHCATKLAADLRIRITLIDKNNYQQFQPLLYQVATSSLAVENAAFDLRDVVSRDNVEIRMSKVVSGDLRSKTIQGENGKPTKRISLSWPPGRRQTTSMYRAWMYMLIRSTP